MFKQQLKRCGAVGPQGENMIAFYFFDHDRAVKACVIAECHQQKCQCGYGYIINIGGQVMDLPASHREEVESIRCAQQDLQTDDDDQETDTHSYYRC